MNVHCRITDLIWPICLIYVIDYSIPYHKDRQSVSESFDYLSPVPYNQVMASVPRKLVSIIAPCYNEAMVLDAFLACVRKTTEALPDYYFEFLFIDDGSQDGTETLLAGEAQSDPRVRLVCLSRNFGHQRAITAGLDLCSGDYIIVMDADLQDPPELIPQILDQLEAGFDLVHTVRTDRHVDSPAKRLSARLFYAVMRRWVLPELPEDAGDFKGFNRQVLEALRQYRERVRFLRGAFATLGFKQTTLPYVRAARYAGVSKYPLTNILRLARDAVVSNSVLPLRFGVYLGVAIWMILPFYVLACLLGHLLRGFDQPVMLLLIGLVCAFFGVILILLGLIGEYLKCIVLEVKQRPLYIVRAVHNLPRRCESPPNPN